MAQATTEAYVEDGDLGHRLLPHRLLQGQGDVGSFVRFPEEEVEGGQGNDKSREDDNPLPSSSNIQEWTSASEEENSLPFQRIPIQRL